MRYLKTCSRCQRTFDTYAVLECQHEAVQRAYGKTICYYCCKRCKYHTKHPLCGAIGCGYIKEVT